MSTPFFFASTSISKSGLASRRHFKKTTSIHTHVLHLNPQNRVKNRALLIHPQKCIKYFKISSQNRSKLECKQGFQVLSLISGRIDDPLRLVLYHPGDSQISARVGIWNIIIMFQSKFICFFFSLKQFVS